MNFQNHSLKGKTKPKSIYFLTYEYHDKLGEMRRQQDECKWNIKPSYERTNFRFE